MNLLLDDSDLQSNQYKIGFNLRNRNSRLDPIQKSIEDIAAPPGLKQEHVTFGNYVILFVAGKAYWRFFSATGWQQISGFSMSPIAPRYWTKAIPVSVTNYARFAVGGTTINEIIRLNSITSAFGQLPGLLVQDNINQPQFIFINASAVPEARTTQDFAQWDITFTDASNTIIATDNREYVPVGNCMEWIDGVLYVVAPDFVQILRSVSGRPLDFVINVQFDGSKGGDAYTTSYTVGVGSISCIRALSDTSLFVAAANANFSVYKDKTNVAVKEFGEFTLDKTPLFNATCLSDRAILDSLGDTKFIDLTGIRSFNAILQFQNEGRNSQFSNTIQPAFVNKVGNADVAIVQDSNFSAAILYDNYEFYAMQTVFGPALIVNDTLLGCWTSFDMTQTGGSRIKQLAKIELSVQRLYAITEDNKLYTLYLSDEIEQASLVTRGVSSDCIEAENSPVLNVCGNELKPINCRMVLNNIFKDTEVSLTPYINNRLTSAGTIPKTVAYRPPVSSSPTDALVPGVNGQLSNLYWTIQNSNQGWRAFFVIQWNHGSLLKYSVDSNLETPMNPLMSQ